MFLLNAVSQTEACEALMAITAMRVARVKRVVYISVHHVESAAWLPHFGGKVGIEAALKASGIPFTILRPNNFYQNDYWFKEVLLQYGVYPQPIGGVGVSRVDVRDIAEAAAIALTSSGHEGQTYDLVGPDAVTGESTAKSWSAALGKPITYGGDDLDAWEKQQLQYLPDWMVFDFRHMYEHFQKSAASSPAPGRSRARPQLLGTRRAALTRSRWKLPRPGAEPTRPALREVREYDGTDPSMPDPLRIAFLGCGFITRVHSRHLRRLGSAFRASYASRDAAKAEAYRAQYGGAASYPDYRAALDDPEIDAVIVAVPPAFHLNLTLQALAAGKHVLVEKPAFPRTEDYVATAAARDQAGRIMLVGENDHYKPLAGRSAG